MCRRVQGRLLRAKSVCQASAGIQPERREAGDQQRGASRLPRGRQETRAPHTQTDRARATRGLRITPLIFTLHLSCAVLCSVQLQTFCILSSPVYSCCPGECILASVLAWSTILTRRTHCFSPFSPYCSLPPRASSASTSSLQTHRHNQDKQNLDNLAGGRCVARTNRTCLCTHVPTCTFHLFLSRRSCPGPTLSSEIRAGALARANHGGRRSDREGCVPSSGRLVLA